MAVIAILALLGSWWACSRSWVKGLFLLVFSNNYSLYRQHKLNAVHLAVHVYPNEITIFFPPSGRNRGVQRPAGGEGETADCGATVWRENRGGGEPELSSARSPIGE